MPFCNENYRMPGIKSTIPERTHLSKSAGKDIGLTGLWSGDNLAYLRFVSRSLKCCIVIIESRVATELTVFFNGIIKKMSDLPSTFVPGFHDEEAVRKMRYNPLGQTGLKVSHLSIGTGGFSSLYGAFEETDCILTIQQAIKSGINYIDTAPWYGQGGSEEILGKALKGIPRKAYYIATKVGRYEQDPRLMFDYSAEKTISSVDNSLKKLGLDYIDIIQVHDVEFAPNVEQIVDECLPTLEHIVRQGKAHYIGITGYPLSVLKQCVQDSKTHIATILTYSRLTLIDDSLKQAALYFQMQGIGIINASPQAMGLLTNKGAQSWHPASENTKLICMKIAEFCKERNVELGNLATYYTINENGPSTHLIGMNTPSLLQSNLDILYNGLSERELLVLKEISEKFLSKLANQHWEGLEMAKFRTLKIE